MADSLDCSSMLATTVWPMETNPEQVTTKLRSACDFCHVAKVKCSGENACARCISLDLPCGYSYASKAGKPKGSRNKKTLERDTRLRRVLESRNRQSKAVSMSKEVVPITPDAMDETANPNHGRSETGLNADSLMTNVIPPQLEEDFWLSPEAGKVMLDASHDRGLPLMSTEAPCTLAEITPFDSSLNQQEQCSCVKSLTSHLDVVHSLHSRGSCRLPFSIDILIKHVNSALASQHEFLKCHSCSRDCCALLLCASSFQLVIRLLEKVVSQQIGSIDGTNGSRNATSSLPSPPDSLRIGALEMNREEDIMIRRFLVRRALHRSRETLDELKALPGNVLSSSPSSNGLDISSLDPRLLANNLTSLDSLLTPDMSPQPDSSSRISEDQSGNGLSLEENNALKFCDTPPMKLDSPELIYLRQIVCRSEGVLDILMRAVT